MAHLDPRSPSDRLLTSQDAPPSWLESLENAFLQHGMLPPEFGAALAAEPELRRRFEIKLALGGVRPQAVQQAARLAALEARTERHAGALAHAELLTVAWMELARRSHIALELPSRELAPLGLVHELARRNRGLASAVSPSAHAALAAGWAAAWGLSWGVCEALRSHHSSGAENGQQVCSEALLLGLGERCSELLCERNWDAAERLFEGGAASDLGLRRADAEGVFEVLDPVARRASEAA